MTMNLLGFAAALGAAIAEIDVHIEHGVEKGCKILKDSAQAAIGTYSFGWPPLGESAIAKHGDTPLLDTGAMKESIDYNITRSGHSVDAYVGTSDPKAAWQEFGTSKIPARPFMGGALNEKGEEVRHAVGGSVMQVFKGG